MKWIESHVQWPDCEKIIAKDCDGKIWELKKGELETHRMPPYYRYHDASGYYPDLSYWMEMEEDKKEEPKVEILVKGRFIQDAGGNWINWKDCNFYVFGSDNKYKISLGSQNMKPTFSSEQEARKAMDAIIDMLAQEE